MKRPAHCLNCDHPIDGAYCSRCGQKATDLNVPFRQLVTEVLADVTAFDSRMLRTVVPFLTRPGLLTAEYNAGRRVHYVPPFRLYVFMSFVAFLTVALADVRPVKTVTVSTPDQEPVATGRVESPAAPAETPAADELQEPSVAADSTPNTNTGDAVPSAFVKLAAMMENDPGRVNEIFVERFAQVLFLFVPIFALLLKLLYVRQGVLYIRHLTFSAYHHAFVFFVMWALVLITISGIPESWKAPLGALAFVVIAAYSFLSLRRVYGQSRVKTFVKMCLLGGSYMVLLLAGMLATLFISALSL